MADNITVYVLTSDIEQYSDGDTFTVYSDNEMEDKTEEFLDELYPRVSVCGYDYDAGTALKELDPIAFRQEVLNLIDADYRDVSIPWQLYVDGGDELNAFLVNAFELSSDDEDDDA